MSDLSARNCTLGAGGGRLSARGAGGGHVCRCGATGCWETEIGSAALLRAAGADPAADVADLFARATQGQEDVIEAFGSIADWLGVGLVNLVNMLNPQAIVLGGHLGMTYAIASDRVLSQIDGALPASRELVRVCASRLGGDATLIGAAEVAFSALLEDPVGLLRRSAAS